MKIGVSPLTNTIYAGRTRKPKKGPEVWTTKEYITDQAVAAVFEWLRNSCRDGGTNAFEVKYEGVKGRMVFELETKQDQEGGGPNA